MAETVLQRAVKASPFCGNQSKFARAIGTTQQNISNWLRKGSDLPAELVMKAAKETGISPSEWRPDVYQSAVEANDGLVSGSYNVPHTNGDTDVCS